VGKRRGCALLLLLLFAANYQQIPRLSVIRDLPAEGCQRDNGYHVNMAIFTSPFGNQQSRDEAFPREFGDKLLI
jgi:hypothetical protein